MTTDPAVGPEPAIGPVTSAARIDVLDYVRGLAVLGILLVNMPLYAAPLAAYFSPEVYGWFPGLADRAALWFVRIVAESKFYTLFSFLFGLGFGVQMARAAQRGIQGFDGYYRRRLLVLLGIGTIHLLFFWIGDVLHVYAFFGFLLLLFRNRAQKTLVVWALCLTLFPYVAGSVFLGVQAARSTPEKKAEPSKERAERRAAQRAEIPEIVRVYADGSRREVQDLRTRQAVERLPMELGWGLGEVLVMFLAGLWVARAGVLENLGAHLPLLRRLFGWGVVGVGLTLATSAGRVAMGTEPSIPQMFAYQFLSHVVARPLHALFYATGLILLLQQQAWRRRLAPLAAVGRMALTNYLLHTLVGVTIFNGVGFGLFGLGLYGRVGHAACLGLTVVTWALQLAVSAWWLARYQFGPFEWLWRSLAYGQLQPLRIVPGEAPAAAA